ncbi:Phospholipase D family domain protein [Candidatus Megaera venefica]|uniref:Phospholipase D family domain protein n=1 Tax=Candidatus Megaera venefica TaxID=2055910 RepID=A0ABU5NB82_9RICK|nr:phospholipase D-like domain-containing protein [Candidatus Megaera venefica]MEA0970372.1 Phospholipase D family domain protein [Candidatus Megaera venefica]
MYKFILTIFFVLYGLLVSANQPTAADAMADAYIRSMITNPRNEGEILANSLSSGFAGGLKAHENQKRQDELLELRELTRRNAELSLQLENQRLEEQLLKQQEHQSHLQKKKNSQENKSFSMCFTPPEQCGDVIVNHINQAKQSIRIQAYGFISGKIIKALIEAKNRGVNVEIILDRIIVQLLSHRHYFIYGNLSRLFLQVNCQLFLLLNI